MNKNPIKTRIIALILTIVMVLPTAAFAIDETPEGTSPETVPEAELNTDTPEEGEEAPELTNDIREETGEELLSEPAEPEAAPEQETDEEDQPEEEAEGPALLEGLKIEENPTGTVELTWDAFEGAAYYEASSQQIDEGAAVRTEECAQTFTGLDHGVSYEFVVAAYDESDVMIAQSAVSIKTVPYRITFNESQYRTVGSRVIKPKKTKVNLRKMVKAGYKGYSVVQGGCTDGTYAYYLMVSSKTQKGKVLKVKLKTNKVVKRSKVLRTWHGNGMTYDSKRKKLVVIAREHRKQEITVIDANTLKITRQQNVKYNYDIDAGNDYLDQRYRSSGLAAIAYVKKYDCYIALERVYHNLLIFDPDTFEAIGLAYTSLSGQYPGTFQAMDADDKYVYLLLSYYNRVQPYNLIVAVDWNSENLLPVVNASKSKDLPYVEKAWFCNNDQSGRADAAIRIKTKREAENIYHTTDKNGKEHFYMSEYYGRYAYKKVKRKKKRIYKRDDYVYDLGII